MQWKMNVEESGVDFCRVVVLDGRGNIEDMPLCSDSPVMHRYRK